jgi:hypothetical protein
MCAKKSKAEPELDLEFDFNAEQDQGNQSNQGNQSSQGDSAASLDLSALVVPLLKGVQYQEFDAGMWNALIALQARVRDYVAVLGLELVLDEAEGYAFLRSRPEPELGQDGDAPKRPRLVTRRPLSFPVSLLLALLRKKLAEFDASGGADGDGVRLVLARNDIVELIRVFLPETSNETKLIDAIDTHISKVVELGFLRRLKESALSGKKATAHTASYEVSRILKAFVDAQWLSEFDARLAAYHAQLDGGQNDANEANEANNG